MTYEGNFWPKRREKSFSTPTRDFTNYFKIAGGEGSGILMLMRLGSWNRTLTSHRTRRKDGAHGEGIGLRRWSDRGVLAMFVKATSQTREVAHTASISDVQVRRIAASYWRAVGM